MRHRSVLDIFNNGKALGTLNANFSFTFYSLSPADDRRWFTPVFFSLKHFDHLSEIAWSGKVLFSISLISYSAFSTWRLNCFTLKGIASNKNEKKTLNLFRTHRSSSKLSTWVGSAAAAAAEVEVVTEAAGWAAATSCGWVVAGTSPGVGAPPITINCWTMSWGKTLFFCHRFSTRSTRGCWKIFAFWMNALQADGLFTAVGKWARDIVRRLLCDVWLSQPQSQERPEQQPYNPFASIKLLWRKEMQRATHVWPTLSSDGHL